MLFVHFYALWIHVEDREIIHLFDNHNRTAIGRITTQQGTNEPDTNVRIAFWLHNPMDDRVEFAFSNEMQPTQETYAVGEGMIGQSFLEDRIFNASDVRSVPCYKPTRQGEPPYRAVYCQPVHLGAEHIGVLTVDKRAATFFTDEAAAIIKGLAAHCAIAYDLRRNA